MALNGLFCADVPLRDYILTSTHVSESCHVVGSGTSLFLIDLSVWIGWRYGGHQQLSPATHSTDTASHSAVAGNSTMLHIFTLLTLTPTSMVRNMINV